MSMSYATPHDLLVRYDTRTLGDLAGDAGQRMDNAALLSDPNIQAALDDAAGMIESSAFVGNKYSSEMLGLLSGNSKSFLIRLNCDIAFAFMRQRRGYDLEQFPLVKESFNFLERIRTGERIFDIASVESAGLPSAFPATSRQTILDQNLLANNTRYFPQRRWTKFQ